MSDNVNINGPVKIQDNSNERVAFELMQLIANVESSTDTQKFRKPNSREYYLTLYKQCITVVNKPSTTSIPHMLKASE